MSWRKISTAPKHQELLLYFPETKAGQMVLPEWIKVDRVTCCGPRKPTHWMLLPHPPVKECTNK